LKALSLLTEHNRIGNCSEGGIIGSQHGHWQRALSPVKSFARIQNGSPLGVCFVAVLEEKLTVVDEKFPSSVSVSGKWRVFHQVILDRKTKQDSHNVTKHYITSNELKSYISHEQNVMPQ
jgi:hypothetical protein